MFINIWIQTENILCYMRQDQMHDDTVLYSDGVVYYCRERPKDKG